MTTQNVVLVNVRILLILCMKRLQCMMCGRGGPRKQLNIRIKCMCMSSFKYLYSHQATFIRHFTWRLEVKVVGLYFTLFGFIALSLGVFSFCNSIMHHPTRKHTEMWFFYTKSINTKMQLYSRALQRMMSKMKTTSINEIT